jgi:two-component system sensor histidine kinase YesM
MKSWKLQKRWKRWWIHKSLRQKLILTFACFILLPLAGVGGALSWLYVESNRGMLLDAAVENNRQIIRNIDTAVNPLLRLSMYPLQNPSLLQMMKKDYASVPYPLYEREKDFDEVNGIIRDSIMLYSDLIDSTVIYHLKNHMILGRSNLDYMNRSYLENEFYKEPFVRSIMRKKGLYVPVGIHDEKLLSFRPVPVVSIGRAIVDPFTKEDLGFILFNIQVAKLKSLWSDIHFTDHTRFYLVDQDGNLIYSQDGSEIGKPAADLLGPQQDRGHYFISSSSKLTGWTTVTVIPKRELFGFVYTIARTIAVSLIVLLALSIAASVYIATGITRPLRELERKMQRVTEGDLDVTIEPGPGEVGRIGAAIDRMLQEIRRLIRGIYEEEREKRQMEILALQSQIKPHFMYNTLNAIKWMAKIQGASGIEEALTAFSAVIRFTAITKSEFVTVREEVEFIRNYTKILSFRYLNKFEVEYEIDPDVQECRILKFLLQPLVENAIFHGFDKIAYKGKLTIRILRENGNIVMSVADNGRGMTSEQQAAARPGKAPEQLNAIGISNIRRRIALHFGPGYDLTLRSEPGAGTTATIVVPIID